MPPPPPAPQSPMLAIPSSGLDGDVTGFGLIAHGHRDLVQAVAFNAYGDRCATGSVDGKIKIFNRQKDGTWRMCDHWSAHGGEILELQWLAPTIYPNLLASLGIEGAFKLWTEDDSVAPGRRFSARGGSKATIENRSGKYPYRSFSVKHNEETRYTYFALLASDGRLSVHESEEPETVGDYARIDEFQALPKPRRGEETCFKVRFDPNPEPCYTALRAGMPHDTLSLVVSGLDTVRIFRSRDTVTTSFGAATQRREFYQAFEITGHRGLVRDIAWAPGNIRGFDMIATACQDGFARVFRIDTPCPVEGNKSWTVAELTGKNQKQNQGQHDGVATSAAGTFGNELGKGKMPAQTPSSGIRAEIDKSGNQAERAATGQPGQIEHTVKELCKLESHRSPVWRVDFDDDGQILGTVGDEGKLLCYRQKPDGTWAKSSELAMRKMKLGA